MKKKFRVEVSQTIEVELDGSKFNEAFLAEFRESFYPFMTMQDHAEHIAQLQARGVIDCERTPDFIEGYGPSNEMGIKAAVVETEINLIGGAA